MSKDHVKSDKISGNHTTFIEPAAVLARYVVGLDSVRRVTPGVIEAGLKGGQSGPPRIKITMGDGSVKLTIRQNTSVQTVFIYTSDVQATTEFVARSARDLGYDIHFDKREENDLTLRTRRPK
jgi:hypothetical protein